MIASGADEPELAVGDHDEWVARLQTRLANLQLFDGMGDGQYGDATVAAVRRLQEDQGLEVTGDVDALTWRAIAEAEQRAGLDNPFAGPDPADLRETPVGTLSEDQHWRWDGDRWQPNEDRTDVVQNFGGEAGGGQLSADGQWLWDGSQWQPVNQ